MTHIEHPQTKNMNVLKSKVVPMPCYEDISLA